MDRRTKIIATIGPASESEAILEQLAHAGMNIARLNFSHGTQEEHKQQIATVHRVAEKIGEPIGVLQDLQGPKIRVGSLGTPLQLAEGEQVTLYSASAKPPDSGGQHIPVDFPELFESVKEGDRLLLDDGRLALRAVEVKSISITARVEVGGVLLSHKGINLPGVRLRIAGFTEKDRTDLAFGIAQHVEAVAISFVRTTQDVKDVRAAMEGLSEGKRPPLLIAKLEKPEAMDELENILTIVDGVMVARGDLGVELPPECVPALQKEIIRTANQQGKLVITATQMLESMIENPLPTRAEASDVANAVFDGTDAVMLSAETASGRYPVESVQMMDRIVCEAEKNFLEWGKEWTALESSVGDDAVSMAFAAHTLAHDVNVTAIATFTASGQTAWLMSKTRPRVPILAFTPSEDTYHRLAFLWGVKPQLVPYASSLEVMLQYVDQALRKMICSGDQVVLVCGYPVGAMKPPNMALLHTVSTD